MADSTAQAGAANTRETISLDGAWRFRHESDGQARTANVPNPWQAEFADLRQASGTATYSRAFAVPSGWTDRDVALRFGAVSYLAEVTLNGRSLGIHEGGYLPFEFILPAGTLAADNSLEVKVTLPTADQVLYPDHPFPEIPHGKQSWYGPLGGIWQSVTLEARSRQHLTRCAIKSNADGGAVAVELAFAHADGADAEVVIRDRAGRECARAQGTVAAGGVSLALAVPNVERWSPDEPNLYSATVELRVGDAAVDRTVHSFGFRTIEAREGKLFLNGAPLYIRGALDQDYYPEGICTPPSLEFLEDQLRKAKQLGLNLLRCHIKVPDPRYYEVADRLGILIWTEIPNVATLTAASARRLRETMEGILARDGNHPSIICWTIINEDWGTRLIEDASHRAWLKETFDWLKEKDPTRLVVDNSACIPNYHVKTDINDYHYYRSVPERRAEWEKLTEEFAAGADWTFSPHGDAERRGDEPLVVSEFGVWGLPFPSQVANPDGSEPWWMETGQGWGDGAAYPHSIATRFSGLHLETVFGAFDDFIGAVQGYQFSNLKYQIESMRAHASIMGYVITELTDVHWEANGLMDLNRNLRSFADRFPEINADLVIVPKLPRHAGTAGEKLALTVSIATGGASIPAGATLAWSLDEGPTGSIEVPEAASLQVADLGALAVDLPKALGTRMARLTFSLTGPDGREFARNSSEIAVFARREKPSLTIAAKGALGLFAAALGYEIAPAGKADVVLTTALGPADIRAMQKGARYVVLADGSSPTYRNLRADFPQREQPFMAVVDANLGIPASSDSQMPNISVHPRHGSMWRGDWIAGFSWIRRSGAFAALPGGPLLDLAYSGVVPHHVMTGFRGWEFEGLVHSGVVVGWLQKPAALIAERRVGSGGLVATTFRLLEEAPGADPVAAALFDAVVWTAANLQPAPGIEHNG